MDRKEMQESHDAAAPRHAKLIILGSGPAGYTTAIYAARAMLEPLLIAGFEPGGQLMVTTEVENYPGFASPIDGPWLMQQMQTQAVHVGTDMVADHIVSVDLKQRPLRLIGDSSTVYSCDALVIATGAKAKWLGIASEQAFKGLGVSACATCDGFFYRGKPVIVVGGGNTAVEEALYLANIASRVTIIHRGAAFRAERILQERLAAKTNVEVLFNSRVEEICGRPNAEGQLGGVTHVRWTNSESQCDGSIAADGVFIAIGHAPASELFKEQLEIKPNGYIKVAPYSTATTIPGVFAAGDVADDLYRQAVTAAGMGCMAALEAEKYLADLTHQRLTAESMAAE